MRLILPLKVGCQKLADVVTYRNYYSDENEMETSEVKKIIEAGIDGCEATVTADGSKYTAIVVSDEFEGKTMVAEQKMVYALVNEHIQSGAIHALTIKAYTRSEWADKNS
jgi:acid stress-induced BolA-like protein IbaG/YrbA